jgi:hypothetical protein
MKFPSRPLNIQQLNLYQYVNRSNQRMLSRIYTYCNDKQTNIIDCVFNNSSSTNENRDKIVTYYTTTGNLYVWQGIASYPDPNNPLIISGTTPPSAISGQGIIYIGNISTTSPTGAYYSLLVPGAEYSSAYGPRYNSLTGEFTIVGSYNNDNDPNTYGFLFRGNLSDLSNPANYILTMNYTIANPYLITFAHSTYGDFVVGNSGDSPNVIEESWIYNIISQTYTSFVYPGDKGYTTTLYGIVQNVNGTYTLTGGYSTANNTNIELEYGFIVDMDSNYNFINSTSIQYASGFLTHFEGISITSDPDIYTLAGDSFSLEDIKIGFAMKVRRDNSTGTFKVMDSVKINYDTNYPGKTTSNSILENNVVGLFIGSSTIPFQSSIADFL